MSRLPDIDVVLVNAYVGLMANAAQRPEFVDEYERLSDAFARFVVVIRDGLNPDAEILQLISGDGP